MKRASPNASRPVMCGAILAMFSALFVSGLFFSAPMTGAETGETRVLSIGGSVTEIVYALGQEHRLVARDTTSVFPQAANDLPNVGYMRALSAEGVFSVGPELIISEDGAGPPEAVAAIQAASIPYVVIPDAYSADGIVAKVHAVGDALGAQDQADELADQIATQFEEAQDALTDVTTPQKVLFILSTQGGRILASGTNTAANGIIELAGAVNAISEFEGYKPLTDEAIAAAAPDAILMMDRSGDHSLEDEALFALPSIMPTPAGQARRIVRMNGLYLLGFGPRTAQAALDLHVALYGG